MLSRGALKLTRQYATQAASKASVQAPIQTHGISGRYASALYSAVASSSPDQLGKVEADLTSISQTIKADASIKNFLSNPTLSSKARNDGIAALFKASVKTPSEPVKRFFDVLSENGRLGDTEAAIETFQDIMVAHRGEVKVTITTAAPLEKDLQTKLETALKGSTEASKAKSVKFTNKVNPALLGGLVIDFGDKTIDLSVASKINKLNAVIAGSSFLTSFLTHNAKLTFSGRTHINVC
ncbi:putative ATP5-F1F0-ATPase complex, OSCP subunit [Atractiella rhizophila]|nr:putative ATP5-F1F0-ATPase complex, OSCP subunit [Atractiella rhizophila]